MKHCRSKRPCYQIAWVVASCLCFSIGIQSQNLDSLKAIAHDYPTSKRGIRANVLMAEAYLNKNTDSARFLASFILITEGAEPEMQLRASLVKAKAAFSQDSLILAKIVLRNANVYVQGSTNKYWVLNYHLIRGYISELNADMKDAVEQNQMGLKLAISENDTAYQSRFYNNLGLAYKNIQEPLSAIHHLKKAALLFAFKGSKTNEASSYINIGSTYLDIEIYDSARVFFDKALEIFEDLGGHYEMAILNGNYARLAHLEGNFQSAIEHLHQKLNYLNRAQISTARPIIQLRCQGFEDLSKAHLELQHLDSAAFYCKLEDSLAATQNMLKFRVSANLALSAVYESWGRTSDALKYLKIHLGLKDSLNADESLSDAKRQKEEFELQLKYARDEKLRDEQRVIQERKNAAFKLVILLLIVVLVVVYGLYQRSRKKHFLKMAEEMRLKAEKRKLERDVAVKENELTAKHIQLSESESRIESTLKEIKEAIIDPGANHSNVLQKLARQIEGKSGQKSIAALDDYLQQSDRSLFEILSQQFPSLTRSDLRLCAFLRLNLSTKEISAVTQQTTNSIKVARYRLRKKMGLNSNESIVGYLNRIVGQNT